MTCIPILNNNLSKGNLIKFESFFLCADYEILVALSERLNFISYDENSKNKLNIELDSVGQKKTGGYFISVEQENVTIKSDKLIGLRDALSTLKMLLFLNNGYLPKGIIEQHPSFENRGIMLDVSRGKMPTLEYLKNLVCFMADLKYNILQIYCEDKLELSKHPNIGKSTGVYTENQIKELDEVCAKNFIELQPCIQTYSHMHGVLRTPGYSHMSENDVLFSFAAGNEDVYSFVDDMFFETLPWFKSKTLNINMDEAYDIGTGFSKQEVEQKGKGEVFLNHICRIIELARKNGAKKILLWGDVAGKYPELLERLPQDTVVVDWNYNPQKTYESLNNFAGIDGPFWAAGGVSSWNSLFPRVYNSYINLINYSAQAKEKGATGFLVTDWGDYGHMQPLGLSLYGYIIGAEQAYNADVKEESIIENNAWPLMFCDKRIAKAFRLLMDSNLAPKLKTGFKTMSIYYFFDDMLNGLSMNGNDKYPKQQLETFETLHEKGEQAYIVINEVIKDNASSSRKFLDTVWKQLFGEHFLYELQLSAKMTVFTGKKGKLAFNIIDSLNKQDVQIDEMLSYIADIKQLYKEFIDIRRDFERVWNYRAYELGIEGCLTVFDKAGLQLAETAKWLASQIKLISQGEKPDSSLTTYEAAKGYQILWTSDFKNFWDRAYPWQ